MSTTQSTIAPATDRRTIRQPFEHVDKTIIDKLLTDLAQVPEKHYWTLDEDDFLYNPPTDIMVVPASTVRDPGRTREAGEEFLLGDIYDLNGRRIPLSERPEGWWDQQSEIRKPGRGVYSENAVHRLGDDYLVVGRGQMFLTGETTIDGERAFEVVCRDIYFELQRERRAEERRAFLDANPIIEASQPWWATGIDMEQGDELGEISIDYMYSINVDDLFLRQEATLKSGKITLGEIELQNGYHTVPVEEFATLADQFRGLGYVLDRLAEEGRSW